MRLLLALALSCGAPPTELELAARTCDLEVLRREAARLRVEVSLRANEPAEEYRARWELEQAWGAIRQCGTRT